MRKNFTKKKRKIVTIKYLICKIKLNLKIKWNTNCVKENKSKQNWKICQFIWLVFLNDGKHKMSVRQSVYLS